MRKTSLPQVAHMNANRMEDIARVGGAEVGTAIEQVILYKCQGLYAYDCMWVHSHYSSLLTRYCCKSCCVLVLLEGSFRCICVEQVYGAELLWVDRLGCYIHLNVYGRGEEIVRVQFHRPVSDERDARSVLTMISQVAWEKERNYIPAVPESIGR